MRRALVVGGTGPTGPFIVNGLRDRGYAVAMLHTGRHERDEIASAPSAPAVAAAASPVLITSRRPCLFESVTRSSFFAADRRPNLHARGVHRSSRFTGAEPSPGYEPGRGHSAAWKAVVSFVSVQRKFE